MTEVYFLSPGVLKTMIYWFLVERTTEPSAGIHRLARLMGSILLLLIGRSKLDGIRTILLS